MESIKHFNKLQENEMQKEIRNYILNDKIHVNFCNYEYYENSKIMKYNLHQIPIKGNIIIVDQGHNISGNGKPYASKILESPTWLEICKIANDLIITTGTFFYKHLHDICVVQDLGNIKICCLSMGGTHSEHKMIRL